MYIYNIFECYGDDYQNHQLLKEIFPGKNKILYQKRFSSLFVISSDLTSKEDGLVVVKVSNLEDELSKLSNEIDFSIRLNGVKAVKRKKYPLFKEQIPAWVDWKLEKCGVKIINKIIDDEGMIVSKRKDSLCYHSSLFVTGRLIVTDKDLFRSAIYNGIGHGKAFGFGLLNVFASSNVTC